MESIGEFFNQNYPSSKFGTTLTCVADVQEGLKDVFGDPDEYFPIPRTVIVSLPREELSFGYAVVRSPRLVNKLFAYLQREIINQAAIFLKQSAGSPDVIVGGREYESARADYQQELQRVLEACILNSFGQKFTEVFWLDHSMDVADAISKVRNKILEIDKKLAQHSGDQIRYRVFSRFMETADQALEAVIRSLGQVTQTASQDYRSLLFRMMRENVLVFTELPARLELDDLESFVRGYLNRDFKELKAFVQRLREGAAELFKKDASFRAFTAAAWPRLKAPADAASLAMLFDSRYRNVLLSHPKFTGKDFPPESRDALAAVAKRMQQYDFIHYFRALVRRCAKSKDLGERYCLETDKAVVFDDATRPLNFGYSAVLDNRVQRFGLVYDITAFSQTYFEIRASSAGREKQSAREMFEFQETLAALPKRYPMRFEKFLGDGAFYSSRKARALVEAAVIIQETYAHARAHGFPFNKGLRIAVNWSHYYLLPLRNQATKQGLTYEFFGPGLIELTRLTSGKASKEVEELKELLMGHGYPAEIVHKFFSHIERVLSAERSPTYRAETENREFFVLVDEKGNLSNEGIVTTRALVEKLSQEVMPSELREIAWRGRRLGGFYAGQIQRWIAIREAGTARLKGLDPFPVFEIIAFTQAQEQEGVFQESRAEASQALSDLVLGQDTLDQSGASMTDEAHVVGVAEEPEISIEDVELKLEPVAPAQGAAPQPLLRQMGTPLAAARPPPAAASPAAPPGPPATPLEIACFVYEIEPGKGKCFVIGRYNRASRFLENAVIEPKAVQVTDKARIADIYRKLERVPNKAKERIDLNQFAKSKDFNLVLLGRH